MEPDLVQHLLDRSFDALTTGVLIQTTDGEMVASNQMARRIMGLSRDELHGRSNLDPRWNVIDADGQRIPGEEHPAMIVLRTGEPAVNQIVAGGSDPQNRHWVRLDCYPLRSESGELLGVATHFRDVSEQQRINDELSRSETQVHEVLGSMNEAYLALDRDDRFTYVNSEAERLLGHTKDEVVGRKLLEVFPDITGTHLEDAYRRAVAGETVEFEAYYESIELWLEIRIHPVLDGTVYYVRDITSRVEAQNERDRLLQVAQDANRRLQTAATRDQLTGLFNRASLLSWLDRRLDDSSEQSVALLFIDLDRFKYVNDTHGHAEGDALLQAVAERLLALARDDDVVARLGGDEFVIAIESTSESAPYAVADRVLDSLRMPVDVASRRLVVTASIGVAFADATSTSETLLRDADAALYQAKEAGRNCCETFDEAVRQAAADRLLIESELHLAIERNEIVGHYQAVFDARTGQPVAAEALARWRHPRRGMVGAGGFIPIAEESGMIVPIGDRMLDLGIGDLGRLTKSLGCDDACGWINVSVRQLDEPGFVERLIDRLSAEELVGRIGIEVTETGLTRNEAGTAMKVRRVAEAGIPVAIDDFGTGYSSMARLVEFPVAMLKIDQSFVQGLYSRNTGPVVRAIVELSSAIGATSCAEGVETPEQLARMIDLGVDLVSGYYLGRPVPIEALSLSLAEGRNRVARARQPAQPAML